MLRVLVAGPQSLFVRPTWFSSSSVNEDQESTQEEGSPVTMRASLLKPSSIDKYTPVGEVTALSFARTIPILTAIDAYVQYTGDPKEDTPTCERLDCKYNDGTKIHTLLTTRGCRSSEDEWTLWKQYPLAVDSIYCAKCENFFQPQRAPVSALTAKLDLAIEAMNNRRPLEAEFWLRRVTNQFPTALRPRVMLSGLLESAERFEELQQVPQLPEVEKARLQLFEETVQLYETLPSDEQAQHLSLMSFLFQNMANSAFRRNRPQDGLVLIERHMRLPALPADQRQKLKLVLQANKAKMLLGHARELVRDYIFTGENPTGVATAGQGSSDEMNKAVRKAMLLCTQAVVEDPRLPEPRFLLGKCAQRLGNPDEAYNHFNGGWEMLGKKDQHFGLELCLTCCQLGSWKEAVSIGEVLFKIVEDHPQSALRSGTIGSYALALALNGQHLAAEPVVQLALQQCPTEPPSNVTTIASLISALKANQLSLEQARHWAKKLN